MTEKLIVNLKAYQQGTDTQAGTILNDLNKVSTPQGVDLVVAVNPVDLRLADRTNHAVIAQHLAPHGYGSHTGRVLPRSAEQFGATGTLLNHSERQISLDGIKNTKELCGALGLTTYICADSLATVKTVARLEPDYVAIEPPELIGGDTSVSDAKPELIAGAADACAEHDVSLLCGAGVKSAEDVAKARELGAKGVLVASGVVKEADPVDSTESLLNGF